MSNPNQQQGLTLIGFLFILALLLVVALLGMKLYPIYQEYYAIRTSMNEIAEEPGMGSKSANEIKEALFRKLYVNYVKSITRKDVEVSKRRGTTITVDYEVREDIVANIDALVSFDYTVTIGGPSTN